jgi:hypothetical protein
VHRRAGPKNAAKVLAQMDGRGPSGKRGLEEKTRGSAVIDDWLVSLSNRKTPRTTAAG